MSNYYRTSLRVRYFPGPISSVYWVPPGFAIACLCGQYTGVTVKTRSTAFYLTQPWRTSGTLKTRTVIVNDNIRWSRYKNTLLTETIPSFQENSGSSKFKCIFNLHLYILHSSWSTISLEHANCGISAKFNQGSAFTILGGAKQVYSCSYGE